MYLLTLAMGEGPYITTDWRCWFFPVISDTYEHFDALTACFPWCTTTTARCIPRGSRCKQNKLCRIRFLAVLSLIYVLYAFSFSGVYSYVLRLWPCLFVICVVSSKQIQTDWYGSRNKNYNAIKTEKQNLVSNLDLEPASQL